MSKITVLLVDDHPVVRQGINALLSSKSDLQVVGEAGDGRQGLAAALELKPDIVVLDLALPIIPGLQVTKRLHEELPRTRILILTSFGHDEYLRQAIQAGAAGYVLKHNAADELEKGIREVAAGRHFFSPRLARSVARVSTQAGRPRAKDGPGLTLREGQLLQAIADGCSNKEIAAQLGISVKTVEKHRQKLMNKLGIHETAGLTRYALGLESLQ